MGMALMAVGGLIGLAAFVCEIIILIAAFKKSAMTGILSLCIPFYALYFAFTGFQHPKKGMILGGWLGGVILSSILYSVGAGMMASAAASAAGAGLPAQ